MNNQFTYTINDLNNANGVRQVLLIELFLIALSISILPIILIINIIDISILLSIVGILLGLILILIN